MNPRAAINDLHPFQGCPFGQLGYFSEQKHIITEAISKCNRIESRHDTNNPHSGDVMKKCGMIFEGIKRSADLNNQGICDVAEYAIIREEWH